MFQRFLTYFIYALVFVGALYLAFFIWWLFLPFFLILLLVVTWRVIQARRMWNALLKQAASGSQKSHRVHKVADDNVIDADYEEVQNK